MNPIHSNLINKFLQIWRPLADLFEIKKSIQQHSKDPERFWRQNIDGICARLKDKYILCDKPDIEVLIPIHHNKANLPLLLFGLSKQIIDPSKIVSLTLLMHNNCNKKKWNMYDDGSWLIIKFLQKKAVPVRILTLADPLLTGPYFAWQFLIAKSVGKKIAILDADCVPPSRWLTQLLKPLQYSGARFSGGVRIEITKRLPYFFTTRIYFLWTTIINLFYKNNPNLPMMKTFQGGQAAYNKKLIMPVFKDFLGCPEGDTLFSWNMIRKYGESCFSFSNNPVFYKVTHVKHGSTINIFLSIKTYVLRFFRKGFLIHNNFIDTHFKFYEICLYSSWFRSFVEKYKQQGRLSNADVMRIFNQTSVRLRFVDNRHVKKYAKRLQKDQKTICNDAQLLSLYFEISENCHKPTIVERLVEANIKLP